MIDHDCTQSQRFENPVLTQGSTDRLVGTGRKTIGWEETWTRPDRLDQNSGLWIPVLACIFGEIENSFLYVNGCYKNGVSLDLNPKVRISPKYEIGYRNLIW